MVEEVEIAPKAREQACTFGNIACSDMGDCTTLLFSTYLSLDMIHGATENIGNEREPCLFLFAHVAVVELKCLRRAGIHISVTDLAIYLECHTAHASYSSSALHTLICF